jgi:hypothetical protein
LLTIQHCFYFANLSNLFKSFVKEASSKPLNEGRRKKEEEVYIRGLEPHSKRKGSYKVGVLNPPTLG